MKLPKGIYLEEADFKFYQENDSCDEGTNGQELIIKTIDAGGGKYLVLETKRWALDSDEITKFANILRQIIKFVEERE